MKKKKREVAEDQEKKKIKEDGWVRKKRGGEREREREIEKSQKRRSAHG